MLFIPDPLARVMVNGFGELSTVHNGRFPETVFFDNRGGNVSLGMVNGPVQARRLAEWLNAQDADDTEAWLNAQFKAHEIDWEE